MQGYHSFDFRINAFGRGFSQPPHLGLQHCDALVALAARCSDIGGLETPRDALRSIPRMALAG
jgi:hypothetical protein